MKFSHPLWHILLGENLTIESHDGGGKEGHFCHCNFISSYLPLIAGVPLVGQLSLYFSMT